VALMATFSITARLINHASVTVEAANADEAIEKFNSGDFEVDMGSEECVDWEAIGKPKKEDDD
jgi:hypothetical protein